MGEEIDFLTDCTLKSQSNLIYSKNFYITNIPCDEISRNSTCTGDFDNPVDDFWKVIKIIYENDQAQKFQMQNIKLCFLGSYYS